MYLYANIAKKVFTEAWYLKNLKMETTNISNKCRQIVISSDMIKYHSSMEKKY